MEVTGDQEIVPKVSPTISPISPSVTQSKSLSSDRSTFPPPDELLDHIFDLAYSIVTPSTGALSKHLLPFHLTGIYRRISLTKPENIARLVKQINKSPGRAAIVTMLQLDCEADPLGVFDALESNEIQHFFLNLVRLEWLDLGKGNFERLNTIRSICRPDCPSQLRHLATGVGYGSPCPLRDFSLFPALRWLHVTTYEDDFETFDAKGLRSLTLLTRLTISGLFADSLSIASFCSLCPSLIHLTLICRSPDYSQLLSVLPSSLLRLELQCADENSDDLCEQHLSRFTHLQHLVLDDGMFTSTLPSHLLELRALAILELGAGRISTSEMSRLFNKVPINHLKLDLTRGEIGYRLEVDENGSTEGRWVPGEGRMIAGDWVIPEFDLQGDDDFTLEGACEMLREAEEMGIEVEGSIIRAIEVMDACHLEIANIAIYRCFRDRTFSHYLDVQELHLHSRLPHLDLASLDPNNLKLVKTDLPDEGWFALSLEAGEV